MTPHAISVAAALLALCATLLYILRDRAARETEENLLAALAHADKRAEGLRADLADLTRRLTQANAALGMAEDEIARLNAELGKEAKE